jgi:hypothetical protein
LSITTNTISLGTVGVANGGTGATTLTGILLGNGTSAISSVTDGTVGQVLSTNGSGTYSFIDAATSGIPSWATFTTPATGFRAFRLKSAATNGRTFLSFDRSTVSGGSLFNYLSYNEYTDKIELHNQNKGLSIDASGDATFSEDVEVIKSSTPTIQLTQSGATNYKGYIKLAGNNLEIRGSSGAMEFYNGSVDGNSSALRMSISSTGAATFQLSALTNPSGVDVNTVLTIKNNDWSGITMLSSAATGSFLTFGDADAGFRGRILYLHGSTDAMVFETAASEKMRISSTGDVTLKGNGATSALIFGQSTYGRIINTSGQTLYVDSDVHEFRTSGGVGKLTISSTGAATFSGNLTVNGAATFTAAITPLIVKGTNASTMWTEYYYNTSTLAGYIGNG